MGKYDLVFRALRIEQSPAGTSQADPGFELFEAGQRVGDWDFSFSMSDATGNFTRRGVAWDMLPLTESAWKLRVIVRVPGDLQVEKQAAEFIVAPPKLPEPKSGPGAR